MGLDNGSGMLSAHAGDASTFVQCTCVVGTRPLLSRVGQPLTAECLLVHLSLALGATEGSAPRKVVPLPGPCSAATPAKRGSAERWVIWARAPEPLMHQPGQLFMDSSRCWFSEGQAPGLPIAGCSVGWMLNCG